MYVHSNPREKVSPILIQQYSFFKLINYFSRLKDTWHTGWHSFPVDNAVIQLFCCLGRAHHKGSSHLSQDNAGTTSLTLLLTMLRLSSLSYWQSFECRDVPSIISHIPVALSEPLQGSNKWTNECVPMRHSSGYSDVEEGDGHGAELSPQASLPDLGTIQHSWPGDNPTGRRYMLYFWDSSASPFGCWWQEYFSPPRMLHFSEFYFIGTGFPTPLTILFSALWLFS